MDNYIVSARKYRPTTFQSVVGQKSLTTTLKNAIQNNKLAHAYLFCGPRGVGKTTCARIFAKTINCLNPRPDGEACNECESCQSFNENRSYNIYELDAASNNGVDEMRSLTEQVRIPPQIGRYKVYIIDEVHMLSNAAFNAFLKTLEEPPHHAIFILATTEKHKIIPTILSRCQIYDFSRISINDIVENLEHIAQSENVSCEKEALNMIAQKADGGMRDALSIFDQVVSFSEGNVTYQAVIENLNVLDYDYYFRLTETILAGNVPESLVIFNEILRKGFDGQQIVNGLADFFRDVMVCKDPQTIVLFEAGEAVKNKYLHWAQQCSNEFLYKALEWSNEADLNYRYSKNKRLLVELLLIRLCQFNHQSAPIDDKKKIKPVVLPATPTSTPTPTVNQEVPKAQVISKDNLRISINKKSLGNDSPEIPKTEVVPDTIQEERFLPEDLERAWCEYAENEEDTHLKYTVLNVVPRLQDDNRIQIAVFNPDQQKKLQEKASTIKSFLTQRLKNARIQLDILVTEDKKEYIPYGGRDIFEYMAEKNLAIVSLAKEFNLKLD
ncbi:DNA polymerase III subunit gamma/tau [Bacteroidia bacterium]|nr:DNA polymerase III subunit gamma/tau [Bacteroidia bacterium]